MTSDVLLVYSIQIVLLIACIYMVARARRALNGLARGLVLLLLLLIVRRIDDMFLILDNLQTMILSTAVVVVITYDIYQIYSRRDVFEFYLENRKKRIEQLEQLRRAAEARKRWDDETLQRWL